MIERCYICPNGGCPDCPLKDTKRNTMNLQNKTILLLLSLCLALMGVFVDELFTVLAIPTFLIYYILKIEQE